MFSFKKKTLQIDFIFLRTQYPEGRFLLFIVLINEDSSIYLTVGKKIKYRRVLELKSLGIANVTDELTFNHNLLE